MSKWTIKELNEMDDFTFAMCILSERKESLNQEAPLAKKLAGAYRALEGLRDIHRNKPDVSIEEAIYRKVQHEHLIRDIGQHMQSESYESIDSLEKHGLSADEVLANAGMMARILELLPIYESEHNFWAALDCAISETMKEMAPIRKMSAYNNFPAFSPYDFEIRTQVYGNSGGNCMVGTVKFYLPDAKTSVWVNCSREAVSVYVANIIWNEDGSDYSEDTEDYLLFQTGLTNDIPYTVKPWLSMIKEALAYTIEREMSHSDICTDAFSLPVDWLPDSVKERVEPAYLDWLKKLGKEINIGKGGVIVADNEYVGCVTREVKPVDEQPEYDESEPMGDDVYMFRPAVYLPIGWGWEEWGDSSGRLVSPEGKGMVSYDLQTKEYKIDGAWLFMDDAGLDMEYLEKLVYKNQIISKSK